MFKLVVFILSVGVTGTGKHSAEFIEKEFPNKLESRAKCLEQGFHVVKLTGTAFDFKCIKVEEDKK